MGAWAALLVRGGDVQKLLAEQVIGLGIPRSAAEGRTALGDR